MSNRSKAKAVRFSEESLKAINDYPGKNFTNKLESIVQLHILEEKQTKDRIKVLELREAELMQSVHKLLKMNNVLREIEDFLYEAQGTIIRSNLKRLNLIMNTGIDMDVVNSIVS